MAGDWIKMRVDLRDDPAVFKLAEILCVEELHVIGSLFCFWSWVDKHAVDGRVDGATSRLIDKVSMTPGFADALVAVGWLDIDENGVTMPNFQRHNGESAKERSLKNARQARWRAKRDGNVDALPSTQTSTVAPTREEKRREDKTKADAPLGFDTFWSAYPNKKGKGQALKVWSKLKPSNDLLQTMLDALRDQKQSDAWVKDEGRFIPHPATWLNGMRWEDEVDGVSAAPASRAAQIQEAERKEAERRSAASTSSGPTMLEVMKSRKAVAA